MTAWQHSGPTGVAFHAFLATIIFSLWVIPAQARHYGHLESLFANVDMNSPGCAVGVQEGNNSPIFQAFGSADLEHKIPNTAETIFEAGSVSKQFTAAAILLLAHDGRLSLQDDIRKYLPEIPDYGTPITVRELLEHTSGLRDWGEVEEIAGWPRGERMYSLKDVLGIAAAQKHLNYPPGTIWSYTNTGYNLAAVIVERITGQSLAAFSHDRIFVPLGMNHTSWRDDFRRVVPGRAIAFSKHGHNYTKDMPFENAYGNGGLLTTVGDLLVWNRALDSSALGTDVTKELLRKTVLRDGQTVDYARGIVVGHYGCFPEIAHSGATAGYRAWLARYPDQALSVALLCNDGSVNPVTIGHKIADIYLPPHPGSTPLTKEEEMSLAQFTGWYVDPRSGEPLHLLMTNERLHVVEVDEDLVVVRGPNGRFMLGSRSIDFGSSGEIELSHYNAMTRYVPVGNFKPNARLNRELPGRYRSDEADVTYIITKKDEKFRIQSKDRPDLDLPLIPAYAEAFTFNYFILRIIRDESDRITGLRLSSPRMWNLSLERLP